MLDDELWKKIDNRSELLKLSDVPRWKNLKKAYLQIEYPDYINSLYLRDYETHLKKLCQLSIPEITENKIEELLNSFRKCHNTISLGHAINAFESICAASRNKVIKKFDKEDINNLIDFYRTNLNRKSARKADAFKAIWELYWAALEKTIIISSLPFRYISFLCRISVTQDYTKVENEFNRKKWKEYWLSKSTENNDVENLALIEMVNIQYTNKDATSSVQLLIEKCYPDAVKALEKAWNKYTENVQDYTESKPILTFDYVEKIVDNNENIFKKMDEFVAILLNRAE